MKKILLLMCIALAIGGCKEKESKVFMLSNCNDEINREIATNADAWCVSDVLYKEHEIDVDKFNGYVVAKWGQTMPTFKKISWDELQRIIGLYRCYSRFIQFNIDRYVYDNSCIYPELVECFTTNSTCYSIPLIQKVVAKNKMAPEDFFELTRGIKDNKEIIIFKVINKNFTSIATYTYYDVSHFPAK